MGDHLQMELADVGHGTVVFTCRPDESHCNPLGTVHGGLVSTLLDSALGCAAHTTLPAGTGYTSIEITVNYLRPVQIGGLLTCTGRVTKPGRQLSVPRWAAAGHPRGSQAHFRLEHGHCAA